MSDEEGEDGVVGDEQPVTPDDAGAVEPTENTAEKSEDEGNIESMIMKELEDAEKQAIETAKIICELKQGAAQLLTKEKLLETEAKELDEKNKLFKEQMALFEARTKKIQQLIDQASALDNLMSSSPGLGKPHNEDTLPKVIICGITENNIPKIIVCDDRKKAKDQQRKTGACPPCSGVAPESARRQSNSYNMQENVDLERKRCKPQEDLHRDQTVENLQRRLQTLQNELRTVCKENHQLSENLQHIGNRKSASHHNLTAINKISQGLPYDQNTSGRRKSSTASFLKRNSELIQSYKPLLTKPLLYNFGDADAHFRQSLRTYNSFDINLRTGIKSFRASRSAIQIKLDKKTPFCTPFGDGFRSKSKVKSKKSPHKITTTATCKSPVVKNHLVFPDKLEEEEEVDVFYSPNSQLELVVEEEDDFKLIEVKDKIEEESEKQEEEDEEEGEAPLLKENESVFFLKDEGDSESDKEFKMAEDDLQSVEQLVKEAGSALNEVVAENLLLQEAMFAGEGEGEESAVETTFVSEGDDEVVTPGDAGAVELTENTADCSEKLTSETEDEGEKKVMGYDPNIDAMVIKELEDAEQQAMETAKIIYELKQRVAQLLSKEKMTETEAKELEEKNKQLKEQMALFEAKTKKIQQLIDQASMFENLMSPRPGLTKPHNEDMLPKVIICGITENNMPKIIVCDDKKKPKDQQKKTSPCPPCSGVVPQFAKRLSESYNMQERLAAENADLEGKRYKLQEDLLHKDHAVDSLQRKLQSLQGELRMVCKENCLLSEKLQRIESIPIQRDTAGCSKKPTGQRMPCGKNKGPCPADVETRLQEYSDTTQQLEKQLCQMESEVRCMKNELIAVQTERQHLEQHRRMLQCPPTPPPCMSPCAPPPCIAMPCGMPPCMPPPCGAPPCMGGGGGGGGSDQQLRELREQYNRLQDDYKGKVTEVAGLRADVEKLKQIAKDSEELKKLAEDKVREYEKEFKSYKSEKNKFMGSKEQLIEQEQQLNVAKQRFREAQDELEELRALIQDQQAQLDDYRNKYLQAQQQVEEQRRQIDMMEMENNRISEQVNLEIQRVKNQFQEKLQELTPLPDILKATQLKLQEAQQMHLLAERNNENLIHELQAYRDKAAAMANQMEKVRSDQQLGADEKVELQQRSQDLERKVAEAEEELDRLQKELVRMEEIAEQNEKRVQEKLHEIAQLVAQLETVREESARQVARTKDRCETVRRSMQNQIADLERQLAQSRAQARSAQKDRDDIRQKMQAQINNLNENFEDAQMRIRNLQGHVNFLKNSYTSVFPNEIGDSIETCDCGNAF
ncbi:hypothetical protein RN001_010260 [Aquatica leii]|uniref:Uncharacterized protein n=1 Tax=Aquatica leii TaxID=1421715 RepID=A0AAN7SFY8_9COLE|nr:hypothetical protein RN001_010260 [Aquatica leii]